MHRYEGRHRHAQEREARRRARARPAHRLSPAGLGPGAVGPCGHSRRAGRRGGGRLPFRQRRCILGKGHLPRSLSADQLQELNASVNLAELESDRATGHLQANQRVLAAAGVAQAAAAEAARLEAERAAAADRAARDAQRGAAVASAQSDPRSAARALLADFGWNDSQFLLPGPAVAEGKQLVLHGHQPLVGRVRHTAGVAWLEDGVRRVRLAHQPGYPADVGTAVHPEQLRLALLGVVTLGEQQLVLTGRPGATRGG